MPWKGEVEPCLLAHPPLTRLEKYKTLIFISLFYIKLVNTVTAYIILHINHIINKMIWFTYMYIVAFFYNFLHTGTCIITLQLNCTWCSSKKTNGIRWNTKYALYNLFHFYALLYFQSGPLCNMDYKESVTHLCSCGHWWAGTAPATCWTSEKYRQMCS